MFIYEAERSTVLTVNISRNKLILSLICDKYIAKIVGYNLAHRLHYTKHQTWPNLWYNFSGGRLLFQNKTSIIYCKSSAFEKKKIFFAKSDIAKRSMSYFIFLL